MTQSFHFFLKMKNTASSAAADDLDKARDQVSALGRGLALLDGFHSNDRFLGLQELADRADLPKATAFRLANTLVANGYLEFSEGQGKYCLGSRVIALGFSALGSMRVRQVARPFMRELAESCGASVGMGSRDRHTMLYVENAASAQNQNFRLNIGSRVLLATSAMGRAYYCGLDEDQREKLVDEISARHPAERSNLKRSLEQGLKDFRKLGFCLSVGDWQSDVNAVGVPYRSADGTAVLGMNVCGPSFQLPEAELVQKWGPRLINMVRNVEAAAST